MESLNNKSLNGRYTVFNGKYTSKITENYFQKLKLYSAMLLNTILQSSCQKYDFTIMTFSKTNQTFFFLIHSFLNRGIVRDSIYYMHKIVTIFKY